MHYGATPAACGNGEFYEEGSLNKITFIGSFPNADFKTSPPLPEVAFLGRSNVGKSSLINALVGRKALARTSKDPGKTRDCTVYQIGEELYLVDLPGYGYAQVSKGERKRMGGLIESYVATRSALAGVVWLLDIRRDPSDHDLALGEMLGDKEIPTLTVVTKSDKLGKAKREEQAGVIARAVGADLEQTMITSSTTGDGIDDLRKSIVALAAEVGRAGRP